MAIGAVNYASLYFKYKIPANMHRELAHKSLKRLKLDSQANVSSAETDLEVETIGT